MQRKNYFLKRKFKSGMAMVMAIATMVILATIMALAISLTTKTSKQTTDLYLYEQAVLLSKSATEYALLKISEDGPCSHTNDLNFKRSDSDIYDINISLKYIYTAPSPCTDDETYFEISTDEQNGSILIDISVSVNDITVSTEPIRYFKRTIQKL